MLKRYLLIIIPVIILAGASYWLITKPKRLVDQQSRNIQSLPTATPSLETDEQISPTPNVPIPSEEDIIRLFFSLINEDRIPEAISMMSPNMVPDDNTKQAWGVHFNAIESIQVQQVEPYMEEAWTENKHTYQVTLETYVSAEAADAPIPYYGWEGNPNTRWITLEKNQDQKWQMAEIATGP